MHQPATSRTDVIGSVSGSKKRGGFVENALLVVLSSLITFAAIELALRVYHGELTKLSSLAKPSANRSRGPAASYDAKLGWVPRIGPFVRSPAERWTITEAGIRSNGSSSLLTGRSILAVGDSFTFGDEVLDHETWPARLEQLLKVPVLNGGVFAYGVDQSVLRAGQLLELHRPEVVLLAFIGHDIDRAELSFFEGWKPYFEYVDGKLILQNVPVPQGAGPVSRYATLRRALSYSFVFNAIFSRVSPGWWAPVPGLRRHDVGEGVAVELFTSLQELAELNGAHLVVIALATNGQISDNSRSMRVAEQAQRRGIDVLNLIPEIDQLPREPRAAMFRPRGHYTPSTNLHVAERIRAHLNKLH